MLKRDFQLDICPVFNKKTTDVLTCLYLYCDTYSCRSSVFLILKLTKKSIDCPNVNQMLPNCLGHYLLNNSERIYTETRRTLKLKRELCNILSVCLKLTCQQNVIFWPTISCRCKCLSWQSFATAKPWTEDMLGICVNMWHYV